MPKLVKQTSPMAGGGRLNLDILQALSPLGPDGETDIVTKASRDLLLDCIKGQDHVHKTFFPDFEPQSGLKFVELGSFPVETLTTALLAQAICKHKDPYNFHSTMTRASVEDKLREIYESLQWKKLGFQLYTLLYPDVVRDHQTNVRLRDFMGEDGHVWAEQLISLIAEPAWTKRMQQQLVRGQSTEASYNRDMNALFLKLHLLDPQSVIPAYQMLLNQRALPSVNLELATRNYLGGPLDSGQFEAAVSTSESRATTPLHASRLSLTSDLEVQYGVAVDEFIITHCRNLGLWAGIRPDNCRLVKAKDRCRLM